MEALFLIVPLGVAFSVIAFLFFEKRALQANKLKESQGLPPPSVGDFYEKFRRYETIPNTIGFFLACFAISFILATVKHDPSYGLLHALSYIFLTTFIGSMIIFVLKMKKNLLVQIFAGFLYGAPHIFAASFAFLTRYIIS